MTIVIVLLLVNIWFSGRASSMQLNFTPLLNEIATLKTIVEKSEQLHKEDLTRQNVGMDRNFRSNREEMISTFRNLEDALLKRMYENANLQKNMLDLFGLEMNKLNKTTEDRLDKMRDAVAIQLKSIQEDNSKKIDEIRSTVNEKLHHTLEQKLGDSFKQVSDRLELVHKGLGEMQVLATGVGDLKRVLSNVKTKGILGEYILENILEQILSPWQYEKNVKVKNSTNDIVEFAIKIPSKAEESQFVYMPIDSKFPTEDYYNLIQATENMEIALIETSKKELNKKVKLFAKDIREKYLNPPVTTDFAILFLPIEGLYAEVIRQPELIEILQRDFKVIIAGPSTLAALLNSLQMGFRTLAIEKRSTQVWKILIEVKSEFSKFGEILDKTQKKLQEAAKEIDQAGSKSRTIERRLSNVESIEIENIETKLD